VSLGASRETLLHALIRQASLRAEDLVLKINWPIPRDRPIQAVTVEIAGQKAETVKNGGTFVLKRMKPGERRWLALKITSQAMGGRASLPVTFTNMHSNLPVNGFTIEGAVVKDDAFGKAMMKDTLVQVTRMEAMRFANAGALRKRLQSYIVRKDANYRSFLSQFAKPVSTLAGSSIRKGDDLFGLSSAARQFTSDWQARRMKDTLMSHQALLNRLDSNLTRRLIK
jgi:hypothetical protein